MVLAALLLLPGEVTSQVPSSAAPARPNQRSPLEQATEGLLKAHAVGRRSHYLADADLLTASLADDYREVNRGRISTPTAAQLRQRFAGYFGSVRFLEWEDVRPPLVSLAPSGDWGEVVVEKRVRTIPAGSIGEESSVRYAWTERWAYRNNAWVLMTISSTERNDPDSLPSPLADRIRAWTILKGARRALGGDKAVANVSMLRFIAECQGPRGSFRTTIASARDGRMLFFQEFPNRPRYRAGVSLGGRWEESGGRVVDSLGAVTESVLRAHEMLLLAISPEARYTAPVARPDEQLDGRAVQVVRFRDGLGDPVDFLFDPASGRPAGFRPINHTDQGAREIVTRFDDWRPAGDLTLPHSVTMTQGTDVYRYRMTEISADWIEDRFFRAN